MGRKSSKKDSEQLGFDMGMILPKLQPAPKRGDGAEPRSDQEKAIPPAAPPIPVIPVEEKDSISEAKNMNAREEESSVLTVGELTHRITNLLEKGIGMIWVEGEVSNLRRQASGHLYFTLKDEMAQLSCVLFARTAAGQGKLALRDGLQVQLHGQISVYQPRGQYQLMVRLVQPKGEGLLQARFEELKRRLATEGLFDQARKRTLPRFPRRIGVVTSPTGAAIHDFLHVLHRRHPGLRVVISPVRVQGRGAAAEIAAAITEFSAGSDSIGTVDVIVVTRGGGSLEDLWEFNEEVVARAITTSTIPVVSAVGHEIDFSIADFVADLRAPTPSAAAELLAADGAGLLDSCRALVARIGREASAGVERHRAQEYRLASATLFREPLRRLDEARQTSDRIHVILSDGVDRRLEQISASLATAGAQLAAAHPGQQLARVRQEISSLGDQLQRHILHRLEREQGRLARTRAALSALSPEATLARGFSITRNGDGKVITSSLEVTVGEKLRTQLAQGEIISEVKQIKSNPE